MRILAGDIGGTKSLLALFSSERGYRNPIAKKTFSSQRYSAFEVMVRDFLAEVALDVDSACLAVAGPVVGGRVRLTNLGWSIDGQALCSTFGWSITASPVFFTRPTK